MDLRGGLRGGGHLDSKFQMDGSPRSFGVERTDFAGIHGDSRGFMRDSRGIHEAVNPSPELDPDWQSAYVEARGGLRGGAPDSHFGLNT